MNKVKKEILKIQPYPIESIVARMNSPENTPAIDGQIIRVEEFGVLFKTPARFFKMGDYYVVNFELPVMKTVIAEEVRVVKSKESYEVSVAEGKNLKIVTVEFHFKALSDEARLAIRGFMFRIGQKRAA